MKEKLEIENVRYTPNIDNYWLGIDELTVECEIFYTSSSRISIIFHNIQKLYITDVSY